jgi:ribosomal protein L37AE/L43A
MHIEKMQSSGSYSDIQFGGQYGIMVNSRENRSVDEELQAEFKCDSC